MNLCAWREAGEACNLPCGRNAYCRPHGQEVRRRNARKGGAANAERSRKPAVCPKCHPDSARARSPLCAACRAEARSAAGTARNRTVWAQVHAGERADPSHGGAAAEKRGAAIAASNRKQPRKPRSAGG